MRQVFFSIFLFITNVLLIHAQEIVSAELSMAPFTGTHPTSTIYNLMVDRDGIIWAASDEGALIIDPGNNITIKKLDIPHVTDLVQDNQGRVWAASGNVIYQVANKMEHILPNDGKIVDLEYHSGLIWIATDKGLFTLRPRTGRITRYHKNNSKLKSNKINFVHADRHHIIWIGTDAGYVRIEGEKWELEDEKYKMYVTAENNEGQWIISDDDMFLINQYNRLFPVGIDEALYSGKINDFAFDKEGRIYIASDKLVRYNPYQEVIEDFTTESGSISKKCLSIVKDINENFWIGTLGTGLYVLKFADIINNKLQASLSITNEIKCNGEKSGAVTAIVNGGKSPYNYSWSNGITGSNTIDQLAAGSYTLTITDNNQEKTIESIIIEEPDKLMINELVIDQLSGLDKNDGRIQAIVSGGVLPVNYEWNNGAKGEIIDNLKSGKYTLKVTDRNGCLHEASAIIKAIKLIPELDIDKVDVGTTLRLEQLYFDADSMILKPENYPILEEIYDFMVAYKDVSIEIGGHTNTIPSHEYCDRLSTERAKSVAYYLYQKGIPETRLSFKGYGKRQPLTIDNSLAGRQKNQRVEIKILSK